MDAKLNQSDLIALLAKGSNISMAKAEQFTKNFFELIIEGLEQDGIVKINGLGTFKVTEVASRGSVNVNTGEKIEIKGHKKLVFIPADALKDSVNQPFAMFEPVEVDETYQPDATAADADNEEAADDIVEETAAPLVAEEPVAEENTVETPAVEKQPVEEPVIIDEPETEVQVETAVEPEAIAENEVVVEEQNSTTEPQQETVAAATDEEPVVVQEKPAEPVMVPVPEKKHKQKNSTVAKKRKPVWLYTMIAAVVVAVAYWGYTAFFTDNGSVDEDIVAEETILAAEPNQETADLSGANVVVETDDEFFANENNDAVTVVENDGIVDTNTLDTPFETEETEVAYVFVVVDELASIRLQDISPADTTLYVAKGDYCLHTVAPDETLTKIARKYYGDKKLWPYIVKYNNMDKPDALRNGMEIRIPLLMPKK